MFPFLISCRISIYLSLCLSIHPGVQHKSLDHFGHHSKPQSRLEAMESVSQSAPLPRLPTCSVGKTLQSKSKIDTYTRLHMPAFNWWPSLNKEEGLLLLACVVGDDSDTNFCWSETISTVAATTPIRFDNGWLMASWMQISERPFSSWIEAYTWWEHVQWLNVHLSIER